MQFAISKIYIDYIGPSCSGFFSFQSEFQDYFFIFRQNSFYSQIKISERVLKQVWVELMTITKTLFRIFESFRNFIISQMLYKLNFHLWKALPKWRCSIHRRKCWILDKSWSNYQPWRYLWRRWKSCLRWSPALEQSAIYQCCWWKPIYGWLLSW